MNSSIIQNALGVFQQGCQNMRYEGNNLTGVRRIHVKIQPLGKMASTIRAYKTDILAWYNHYITNETIEGINNKIKILKRQIYGFRNEEYWHK